MRSFVVSAAGLLMFAATAASAFPTLSNMVVFGDSLSDNGNLFEATGNTVPDATYYDQGRFQNGPSYVELLWDDLGFDGDLTPRIYGPSAPQGTNYAVGGARSRYSVSDLDADDLPPALGDPNPPAAFSLRAQAAQYLADISNSADANALHVVFSGDNDVIDILNVAQQFDTNRALDYQAQSVGDLQLVLDDLIGAGARHFLVPSVLDISVTPEIIALGQNSPGYVDAARSLTLSYNQAVDDILAAYAGMTDIEIIRTDLFPLLGTLVDNPQAFGFTNGSDPCLVNFFVLPPRTGDVSICNAPDEYIFWDALHPSAAFHRILADTLIAGIPVPGVIFLLVPGLLGIMYIGARG